MMDLLAYLLVILKLVGRPLHVDPRSIRGAEFPFQHLRSTLQASGVYPTTAQTQIPTCAYAEFIFREVDILSV